MVLISTNMLPDPMPILHETKLAKMEDDLWLRAQQENLAIRYRQYVQQKYFNKHRAEAEKRLRETEAEELWQTAKLGQIDRSAKNISSKQQTELAKLAKDYPDTPAGGRAAKLLKWQSKSQPAKIASLSATPNFAGQQQHNVGSCDQLAANPDDALRVGAGMPYRNLDPIKAVPACLAAVQANPTVPRFKYQLARAYQKTSNPSRAVSLLTELTNTGSYAAAYDNLGWLYYAGKGVRQSTKRAAELFKKGAEAGSAEAMHSMGVLYEKSRNYTAARQWYNQALQNGYGRARRSLRGLASAAPSTARQRRPRSEVRRSRQNAASSESERINQQMGLEVMKGVIGIIVNKTQRR